MSGKAFLPMPPTCPPAARHQAPKPKKVQSDWKLYFRRTPEIQKSALRRKIVPKLLKNTEQLLNQIVAAAPVGKSTRVHSTRPPQTGPCTKNTERVFLCSRCAVRVIWGQSTTVPAGPRQRAGALRPVSNRIALRFMVMMVWLRPAGRRDEIK